LIDDASVKLPAQCYIASQATYARTGRYILVNMSSFACVIVSGYVWVSIGKQAIYRGSILTSTHHHHVHTPIKVIRSTPVDGHEVIKIN
jgi:hypothetical protein